MRSDLEVWMRYLSLVVVFIACGSEAAPAAEAAVPEIAAPAPVIAAGSVASPVVAPVVAPAVLAADGKVGVQVCDAYLETYRGCIGGMKEEFAAPHRKVVEQQAASWAVAKADPKMVDTLEGTCVAARAAAAIALPSCGW